MSRRSTESGSRQWAALTLAASVILAGCASTAQSDLNSRLEAAKTTFGGGFEYLYIPSEGRLADQAFLAMSRVAGPNQIARDLASIMAPAETRAVRVMVTGPSSEKTLSVLFDALSFYEGRQIPQLEILYLGDPADEAVLAQELSKVGAVLRFAPYTDK